MVETTNQYNLTCYIFLAFFFFLWLQVASPFQEAFQELEAEGLGDCPGSWE
jgi:hypothetical protein